jgi:SAM-dependent methyltransferase
VVELGCGEEPDSRSDTTVDQEDLSTVDIVWDLEKTPWPFSDGDVTGVVMRHVIEHLESTPVAMGEISRILEPGGWAEIRVPFGGHWFRDPTHKQYWTYSTPEYFSSNEAGEWEYYFDLPLCLVNRSFTSLWLMVPVLSRLSPVLRATAGRYPGDWVTSTPWVSGELTIEFRKTE